MKREARMLHNILEDLEAWQSRPDVKFMLWDTGLGSDLNYAKADVYKLLRRVSLYELPSKRSPK